MAKITEKFNEDGSPEELYRLIGNEPDGAEIRVCYKDKWVAQTYLKNLRKMGCTHLEILRWSDDHRTFMYDEQANAEVLASKKKEGGVPSVKHSISLGTYHTFVQGLARKARSSALSQDDISELAMNSLNTLFDLGVDPKSLTEYIKQASHK